MKRTHPIHWILKSPASQICLVVQSPASFGRVTCLPPKNASAPWGRPGSRSLTIIVRQVCCIQYLLACQKSQWSTHHNIVKSALPWSRVFRRRHLGRRVTAVTCLRWPTVASESISGVLQCSRCPTDHLPAPDRWSTSDRPIFGRRPPDACPMLMQRLQICGTSWGRRPLAGRTPAGRRF